MAGKPLHELRRAAAQKREPARPEKKATETVPETVPSVEPASVEPPAPGLNEILSDAKQRAARGEENEDIFAMVKSLKDMLRGS